MLELRARWGDDPVHLTPVGYTVLAESLIMSGNSETESRKESAKCRQEHGQEERGTQQERLDCQQVGTTPPNDPHRQPQPTTPPPPPAPTPWGATEATSVREAPPPPPTAGRGRGRDGALSARLS